jgi:asparagine synthase (glutamine-hydrolysing)
MCGIAGQYQWDGGSPALSELERVTRRQEKRGPDGGGVYHLDGVALGHRRLKIFDLSDRAAQPMVDHVLGLALVFNGAIYNFTELRDELKAKGYKFISGSDTEVLLKAYDAWGVECIPRLRGMFAFAIWERDSGKLVLARDRMGIKPLYYATNAHGFKFASTLPALLEFEGVDKSIDKTALHYYLTFHAVPEPLTILSGIKKLPPATVMTVHPDGKTEQHPYWRLEQNESKTNQHFSEKEWLEATREALMIATDRQLAADVPVGVLLSGGLDSSLLVALAASIKGKSVETFSIGFESIGSEQGDEFVYSDIVAKHFGTKHHEMFISNQRLADSLAECIAAMSEPMISHDNIGFYLLSHEVAKHVKVALSGQGADELFAGYHWFQALYQERMIPVESAKIILEAVADRNFSEYQELVTEDYRTSNQAASFLNVLCEKNGSEYALDHLLAYEAGFALTNGPLGRVDNMTMAASLEARVPFLDEAVVDVALAMPMRFKLQDDGKYILKQLGRQFLPKEVVDRPKGYFPVPALKHMEGATLALMREVLSPERIRKRGIFNETSIQKLLENPSDHLTPLGASKLWQVGLLEYWLEQHGI